VGLGAPPSFFLETEMIRQKPTLACLALLFCGWIPKAALAQEHPFQIAVIGPTIQLVDDDADIKGVRLNLIYGKNANVYGLDLGLVNHVNGEFKGLQWGLVDMVDGSAKGWQEGVVAIARENFQGLQGGFINFVGHGEGVQWRGIYNHAEYLGGLQLGLVNVAEDMHGLQIGIINIIRSNESHPVLPLVNWKS
jgi:hypothetical protein